jgi:hypothetical protein
VTSEIAILNRQAVALAADSAVTVNYPEGPKVYNSVSKLFTLSKHAPVGIMVYGLAELTGVPWETIIKTFREELGDKRFKKLEEYADALIRYVNRHKHMFSPGQQEQQLMTSVLTLYRYVLRRIDTRIKRELSVHGTVTEARLKRLVNDTIRDVHTIWAQTDPLPGVPPGFGNSIRRKWRKQIDDVRDLVFERIPLGQAAQNRLRNLAGLVFCVDRFPDSVSGIVVAGFGENDYFPRLIAYDMEGVLLNFIKQRQSRDAQVSASNRASLVPFAQREMVDLFMRGIDTILLDRIETAFDDFVAELPTVIVDGIGAKGRSARRIQTRTRKGASKLRDQFREQVNEYIDENHVGPIVTSIASLPKEDLAAMAEALVNLTSFKRHVTRDLETVGGPIDVAVISKGDGFVWINRKTLLRPDPQSSVLRKLLRKGGCLMTSSEEFDSIDAIRAHFYPESSKLLDVSSSEVLEFPHRMSQEALDAIRKIAEDSSLSLHEDDLEGNVEIDPRTVARPLKE